MTRPAADTGRAAPETGRPPPAAHPARGRGVVAHPAAAAAPSAGSSPAAQPPTFGIELSGEADGETHLDSVAGDGPTDAQAGETRATSDDELGRSAGPSEAASFDVPPRMLGACAARYPKGTAARGQNGQVIVEIFIEADGKISRANIVQSLGPDFDREALAAMRACRYAPARVAGQAVATVVEHRFTFTSDDG